MANLRIFSVVSLSILFVLICFLSERTESQPIDIFDELMNEKFLIKMAEYFMDDDDEVGRRSSRASPSDACVLPPRKGNCRALIRRFRYDPEVKECVEFNFGGCGGNANNYMTHKDCMAACKGV